MSKKKNQQSLPELGCTIHLSTIWTTYNLLTIRQGKNGPTFLGSHKRPYYKMKVERDEDTQYQPFTSACMHMRVNLLKHEHNTGT